MWPLSVWNHLIIFNLVLFFSRGFISRVIFIDKRSCRQFSTHQTRRVSHFTTGGLIGSVPKTGQCTQCFKVSLVPEQFGTPIWHWYMWPFVTFRSFFDLFWVVGLALLFSVGQLSKGKWSYGAITQVIACCVKVPNSFSECFVVCCWCISHLHTVDH